MSDTYTVNDYDGDEGTLEIKLNPDGLLHEVLMSCYERHDETCTSRSPCDNWVCTRVPHHKGPHVGHNTEQVVGIWDNHDTGGGEYVFGKLGREGTPRPEPEVSTFDPFGWTSDEE